MKPFNYLIKSVKNISEIAYETGFTSPSYFSKCFQKKFGYAPSEYLTVKAVWKFKFTKVMNQNYQRLNQMLQFWYFPCFTFDEKKLQMQNIIMERILFDRLGGSTGIKAIVDAVVEAHMCNPAISARFLPYRDQPERLSAIKQHTIDFF